MVPTHKDSHTVSSNTPLKQALKAAEKATTLRDKAAADMFQLYANLLMNINHNISINDYSLLNQKKKRIIQIEPLLTTIMTLGSNFL